MSDTYSLHKDVVHTIFKKVVDSGQFRVSSNSRHVLQILANDLSVSSIEAIIHLMLLEKEYKSLKIGDYVKVKPPTYHVGKEYEVDKEFNPFYSRIKVDLLYHDTNKELKKVEHETNPMFCTRITKNAIKYYKNGRQTELSLCTTEHIDNPDNF